MQEPSLPINVLESRIIFLSFLHWVFDQSALSTDAKEEMYKLFPNARRAHLKTGGNFPYLCRSAEVNLYVQIHLRQFHGTRYAAIDPVMMSAEELEVQKGNLQPSEEPQETEPST
ncbi:unnamed protein product [Ranitomeya imitator]|uniref:Uncharacterized protein n=1 Tax=Ranitomeya imitator TaxID=111125 RepID=A0ABN9M9I8_9NEOB|nr:unnamed protein product [Ranitomeya imitator]